MFIVKLPNNKYIGYNQRVDRYGNMIKTGFRAAVNRMFAEVYKDIKHIEYLCASLGVKHYEVIRIDNN